MLAVIEGLGSFVSSISISRTTTFDINNLLLMLHQRDQKRLELVFVHLVADQLDMQATFSVTLGCLLLSKLYEMLMLSSH